MNTIDIAITGPQGSGKTRLADHLQALLREYPLPHFSGQVNIHDGTRVICIKPPITRGTYRARNGQEVRVVYTNVKHSFPIIGLAPDRGVEQVLRFDREGKSYCKSAWNLVERISDEF